MMLLFYIINTSSVEYRVPTKKYSVPAKKGKTMIQNLNALAVFPMDEI